ncbi:MAG: glutamate 5-kinase [Micrococcales bacterium]|nr:MAG: glutamate 5-kinase [Micrococcales bacterium]
MLTTGRVVVKVGSSSLASITDGVEVDKLRALVDVLAARRASGQEIILVSSAAIAAGMAPLGLSRKPRDIPTAQAAASVGQLVLMTHYAQAFGAHGQRIGQVLLTASDVARRSHYRNAQATMTRLLRLGVLPVVNENDTVATDEIRFGDNDRLAALVAHLVHADALVLLSDVDALYDGPPDRPGSQPVRYVADHAQLATIDIGPAGSAGVGTGGMAAKTQAATIATASGIPTVLTSAQQVGEVFTDPGIGTWFAAAGKRKPTRLLWLAHAAEPQGRLVLDDGAVAAVTQRGASLLPAGIVEVSGRFDWHDAVALCDRDGRVVARGLVAYSSAELPHLIGRSTKDLAAEHGQRFGREVVHRDDLALVEETMLRSSDRSRNSPSSTAG